jgi:predicted  nucleic acid-binding Zn-ribbon protein
LNSRGLIVTFHTPNDRTKHEQCTSLSRDIRELETERSKLTYPIYEMESSIQDTTVRLGQIERELSEISTVQELARGIGGRGGIPGAMAGEGFAQLFALARQKDELERERDRLRSDLSSLDPKLQDAKRRLENVDLSLNRLQDAFSQLGCGLAYFTPSN